VGESAPDDPVGLSVIPPADGPLAPAELRRLTFDGSAVLDLGPVALTEWVTQSGRVADPTGRLISARPTARPDDALSRAAYGGDVVQDAEGPRYSIRLPRYWPALGGDLITVFYTMRWTPEPTDLPPWSAPRVPVEDTVFDYESPSTTAELVNLEGEVNLREAELSPIAGLRVNAIDEDGRVVSTEATTDEQGRFRIRFWPVEAPTRYTLRIASTDPERPLPTLQPAVELVPGVPPAFRRFFTGVTGTTLTVAGEAVGRVNEDADPVALPGARLRFRGDIGEGRFEASAIADEDGRFTATLYPGTYIVDVEPILAGGFRLSRTELTIDDDTQSVRLLVRPRSFVNGEVRDVAGAPVEGARVEAALVEARYADPSLARPGESVASRNQEALTDAEGRYQLQLDPGEHTLTVSPPSGRGLPAIRDTIIVPAEGAGPIDLGTRALPAAAVVTFTLRDGEGAPVSGATVEAFWEAEGGPTPAGAATSDETGRVAIPIPVRDRGDDDDADERDAGAE
jgi:protocatechuate 3,4-dioxygenase beta subunit